MSTDLLKILDRHIERAASSPDDTNGLVAGYVRHAYGRLTAIEAEQARGNKEFIGAYRAFIMRHWRQILFNPTIAARLRMELVLSVMHPVGMVGAKHRWKRRLATRVVPTSR